MKLLDFVLGVGAGLVIYHYWNRKVGVKNPEALAVESQVVELGQVLNEKANKYSDALRQDYDIVLPVDQVSKRVRAKAKKLTDGRYSEDLERQKAPLSI
jgi:hypothetical protein